jgi:tellurite resistance protein TerC
MIESQAVFPWIVLFGYMALLMFIDFFVLNKTNKIITNKQALSQTLFFVANAIIFTGFIFFVFKTHSIVNPTVQNEMDAVFKYLTGYIVELSLSVDNLFVMAVIFKTYKIPLKYQHKLLFLGILGAIFFRAILIGVGIVLVNKVQGINIIFGLFLLYTAFKMLKEDNSEETPNEDKEMKQKNKRFFNLLHISNQLDGANFRTTLNGKRVFTALFGALITIELTDVLFALDSIPAILAITNEPYIIFSSNIFAIMGLRSLYFFLANMLEKFSYLKYSVFVILVYVSIKLMLANMYHLPEWISLSFIVLSLVAGVWVSVAKMKEDSPN